MDTTQLYNPHTGMVATPQAGGVTADQKIYAQNMGFTLPVSVPTNQPTVSNGNPIDASKIGQTALQVPNPVSSTSAADALAVATGKFTSGIETAAKDATATSAAAPAAPAGNQGVLDYLKNIIGIQSTKGDFTAQQQEEQQLAQKTQSLADLNSQALSTKRGYEQQIKAAKLETGGTVAGNQQRVQSLTQKANEDLANIAIQQQAAQGNLQAANDIIKQKVDAKFEPLQNVLDTLKTYQSFYANDLSESEKIKLQDQYATKKASADQLKEAYANVLKSSAENGAPSSVMQSIDAAAADPNATAGSIYAAAGKYGGDTLGRQAKQVQLQNAMLQGQKLQQEVESNKPVTGEFAPVINGISSLVGATKGPVVKKAIADSIAGGDFSTAYATISNAVEDSLTGANQTTFALARTDIGVMKGMRDAIKEYTDAGGNVGFLKGTADDIAKKFGQLAVDPKFASLGVQLEREFQQYRLGMTGAAFSPAESKEYAAVNPRTNASLDLNLATIDGALKQLSNRVTSTINQRLPQAQKIFDLANPSIPTQYKLDNGTIVHLQPDGKTYK